MGAVQADMHSPTGGEPRVVDPRQRSVPRPSEAEASARERRAICGTA